MYMEGLWDCDRLDVLFGKLVGSGMYKKITYHWHRFFDYLRFDVFNLQTASGAYEMIKKHYDLDHELYSSFLDSTMMYTCGYWRHATSLEEAQEHKQLDLIAKQLHLRSGMKVLDLGCGWGALSKFLAEKYKVEVVAVTISNEGARTTAEVCKGLPVEVRPQDYRDITDTFDRIAVIGMMEHVGKKNYGTFLKLAHRSLAKHGPMLIQTNGIDNDYLRGADGWVTKYIYPNAHIPSLKEFMGAVKNLFCMEDWHNFGADYEKTLLAWNENFVKNWPTIQHLFKDPSRFFRMWQYYLLSFAGSFRARKLQLWQVVLSKDGVPGGYISVR